MAKNGVWNLLKELDRVAATTVFNGPRAAAERTVRELQQEGPSWTGRFSNSWEIEGPSGLGSSKGDGQPGEPRPIYSPLVSGQQVTKSLLTKDKLVFTISNFSEYAAEATDLVESAFIRPPGEPLPQTQLGLRKFREGDGGREQPSYRGYIGGGNPDSESGATADLDWFATYVEGGKLNRAVKIEMDDLFS
jgi:hypothetical protein